MTRKHAALAALAGALLVVAGIAMVYPPAALVTAGGALLWLGLTAEVAAGTRKP